VHHDCWVVTADGLLVADAVAPAELPLEADVGAALVVLWRAIVVVADFEPARAGSLPDASWT
jgi:hypothetical protein